MTDPPGLSVAARLAAELEQGGEFVDHGGFDIDTGQALDKLAHYQLGDPAAYVLRFVEAALLAGVVELRLVMKPGSLHATFVHGPELAVIPGPALERLTSVLVNRSPQPADWPARAVLVNLAIGVLAILRRKPSYLAIESVSGDGKGWRMVYASTAMLEPVADAEPGTRISLREAVPLTEHLDTSHQAERGLLREHCRFAPTRITLDGHLVSQQRMFAGAIVEIPVTNAHGVTIGAAGLVHGGGYVKTWFPARLLLLSRGLLIQWISFPDGLPGFLAVVDVPLPRDLSQTTVTRSPELDAVLASTYAAHAWIAARHVYRPDTPVLKQQFPFLAQFVAAVNAMANPERGMKHR